MHSRVLLVHLGLVYMDLLAQDRQEEVHMGQSERAAAEARTAQSARVAVEAPMAL